MRIVPVARSRRGLALALTSALLMAQPNAVVAQSFPGAQGYGTSTPGGRGGPVLVVTSLDDAGPGTLRWALEEMSGPRIVVFGVGGRITLKRQIDVSGRVTVLGQVAPKDGVIIEGARLRIVGDDVILRGLRIRPGRGPGQDPGARDGVTVGGEGLLVERVVIDGNSFAWATDENLSTWGPVNDLTISNNIIAEALHNAGHPKGRHSMGLLLARGGKRISVHGNLFASNWARNPQIASMQSVEIVNNLMVNYGIGGVEITTSPASIDVIGNVFVAGPDTRQPATRPPIAIQTDKPDLRVFLSGNVTPMGMDAARGRGDWRLVDERVAMGSGLVIKPADETTARVLGVAGARTPDLDAVDARIVAAAAAGGGGIVDAPPEMAPSREVRRAGTDDSDRDGIPDVAEQGIGSDPQVADSHLLAPGSIYTFIELYGETLLSPRS